MSALAETIAAVWSGKRILVVGDVMLDKYIHGEVERVSPEAPVPVVRALASSAQPGGAANVAMNLAGLGAQTTVIGLAGADEDATRLKECLQNAGVASYLVTAAGFPTISKLRILGGRQQMLRLDVERRDPVPQASLDAITVRAVAEVAASDAVILSDYGKGVLTEPVCQAIITAARKRGIAVLADPKTRDFRRYRGATTISPNRAELAAAIGLPSDPLPELFRAAQSMLGDWDLEFLIVTLGEKGIAVLRPTSEHVAPAVARQVFDVSGAGDTVIAVLALCLASDIGIETAVLAANAAAGVVVSKVGTVPVQRAELLAALAPEGLRSTHTADKLLAGSNLLAQITKWRAGGQKIAFTNGCFDLLHVGHITLLEAARRTADRLVVGLNSDASIQRLKGPDRPVVSEEQRARVLAALSAVDAVAIFDDDTPLELIAQIQPDVLVKGGDYTEASIVGAPEVRSWGGDVVVVPIVPGLSTTRLIASASGR